MFEEVKYLIHIDQKAYTTYYLFQKTDKILLPIQIPTHQYYRLCDFQPNQPDTLDTLKTAIFSLDGQVVNIKIYLYLDRCYYSYISIEKNGQTMEINSGLYDAINLAVSLKAPILIEKNILKECGYKITKKMIEQVLLG